MAWESARVQDAGSDRSDMKGSGRKRSRRRRNRREAKAGFGVSVSGRVGNTREDLELGGVQPDSK